MVQLDFSTGIEAVKSVVDLVNGYVTEQEPWVLAKDPEQVERLDTVLYTICEALRGIAVLYNPVMPRSMRSMWQQIGAEHALGPIGEQPVQDAGTWGQLPPGAPVTKGDALFPRLPELADE